MLRLRLRHADSKRRLTGVSKPDAPAIPEPKTVARAAGEELSAAEAAYAEASGQGESQDLALARDVAKYGYQVTLAKPAAR